MNYDYRIEAILAGEIPVNDRMLLSLYLYRNSGQYVRLSESVNDNPNWRTIAEHLHQKYLISYPGCETHSTIGRISQEGIGYVENTILTKYK